MSTISELLHSHCLDGVSSIALGELGVFFGGLTGKTKADFTDGNCRFVSYVNVFNNLATDLTADDFVRVTPGERQRSLRHSDILFTGSSETAEEVGMSSVVTEDVLEPTYLNSFCIGFRLEDPAILDPDFTKHLLRSTALREQIIRTASGVTRFNVSKKRLAKVRIPVPPLEVQREIVRILDHFSALEAELEAELEARRRQYAFYRDQFLIFADDVIRKIPMGEIGTFIRGNGIQKSDLKDHGSPAIHYGQVHTYYGTWTDKTKSFVDPALASRLRRAERGDLIIVTTSEDDEAVAKAVAWIGDSEVAVSGDAYIFKHGLEPRYAAYFFQTRQFQDQKQRYITGTKVRRISGESLAKIHIPVPPLEVQREIGDSLDNFDALVNDLSVGLPAELAARRKQYEYYRDRLLTFEEAPT